MPESTKDEAIVLSKDDVEEVRRILFQLNAAVRSSQLYSPGHPQARKLNADLLTIVQKQIEKRGDVTLRFIENQVIFHGTSLCELGEAVSEFAQVCLDRQVQSVTFSRDLSMDELTGFTGTMAISPEELRNRGGIREALCSLDISHIAVERLADQEQTADTSDDSERQRAKEIYRQALSEVKRAMEDVRFGNPISNVESAKDAVDGMIGSLLRKKSSLLGLTSIKNYDDYTFHHSVNVGILSLGLGTCLSLQRNQLEGLGIAGLLHDIGKVSIPKHILNKPGKLDDDEWAMMREHPARGARILRKIPGIADSAPVVAFEHHIKYDLSGYPSLVRRRPLSSYSLVVGIADCYDAMTTLRPYRAPSTPSEALKVLLELVGGDFEPRLMNKFVEMIGAYPVGSFVRLDTNEFAVVYDANPDNGRRPTAKIVINAEGQRSAPAKLVHLGERDPETGHYQRSIVQALNPISKGINIEDFL